MNTASTSTYANFSISSSVKVKAQSMDHTCEETKLM